MYFFIIPLLAASYKVLLRFIFVCVLSCLVMSNSLRPHGLQPVRLLRPWNFPGNNPSMSCHFLHQRIFLTQGSNPCVLLLLHLQVGFYHQCHQFISLVIYSWAYCLFRNLLLHFQILGGFLDLSVVNFQFSTIAIREHACFVCLALAVWLLSHA